MRPALPPTPGAAPIAEPSTPTRLPAGLWGTPLLRAVIEPPAELDGFAEQGKAKKGGGRNKQGKRPVRAGAGAADEPEGVLELVCHVYATRLLFCLVATPAVKALFAHLRPATLHERTQALPQYETCYASQGGAAAAPFSLEGVLKSCEHLHNKS